MNDVRMYIGIDPQIRFGKPCIKGARIAVVIYYNGFQAE